MQIERIALIWIALDKSADLPLGPDATIEIAQLRTAVAHRDRSRRQRPSLPDHDLSRRWSIA